MFVIFQVAGAQSEISQDRESFVELGHYEKLFVKKIKNHTGKHFGVISARYT